MRVFYTGINQEGDFVLTDHKRWVIKVNGDNPHAESVARDLCTILNSQHTAMEQISDAFTKLAAIHKQLDELEHEQG